MWGKLPDKLKMALVITGGIVGLIVLWMVIIRVKAKAQAFIQRQQNQAEVDQLENQGLQRTYADAEYKRMADVMYEAMDGLGTDEEAVSNQISLLRNDLDYLALDSAFGIRDGYDMGEWIRGDFSGSWINKFNNIMNSNGLTKRIELS
jgi:hypothetical protein